MGLQADIEAAAADILTARTEIIADKVTLDAIVNGPSSGPTSLVTTNSGPVKTAARVIAELEALAGTLAPLASPGFTGTPTAPTPADGDNSQKLATTQYLDRLRAIANGLATLNGSGKIPTSQLPDSVLGAVSFQATWNATTNSPALTSGVGTKGHYYIVATAGTTTLDAIAEWAVGDWAIFDGTVWRKIDNTDAVLSVAGLTGAIGAAALKTALAIAVSDVASLQAALDAKATNADLALVEADVAALQSDAAIPTRNAWINGGFEIWQRGTTSVSCSAGSRTFRADRVYVNPTGAAVTQERSTSVPTGARSRYSLQVTGAASVTTCLIGQRIEAAEIPAIKREITITARVYNGTGGAFTPNLLIGTPGAADDFTTVTNRLTQALQSCADAAWTTVTHTVDISGYTNVDNGLQVEFQIPSGSLDSGSKSVRIAEVSVGANATFAPMPHVLEELRCMRFYERLQGRIYGSLMHTIAGYYTVATWTYRVRKRVDPTVAYDDSSGNALVSNIEAASLYMATSGYYPYIGVGTSASAEL